MHVTQRMWCESIVIASRIPPRLLAAWRLGGLEAWRFGDLAFEACVWNPIVVAFAKCSQVWIISTFPVPDVDGYISIYTCTVDTCAFRAHVSYVIVS